MRLFKKAPKMFYSVCLDDGVCKIFFREFDLRKGLKQENSDKFSVENSENLVKDLNVFLEKTNSDKSFLSFMHTSINQGIVEKLDANEELVYQKIDQNIFGYGLKKDFEYVKDLFNVEHIEYLNPFKVLYFLLKNQPFKGTSLFILKFAQTAAVIVASEEKIIYSTMLNFIDESFEVLEKDPDNLYLDDSDEIFFNILKSFLFKFYDEQNEFIDEIFIYDSCSLSRELGYYIFTKLFIKTNVFPIDIIDYANKINIKENI